MSETALVIGNAFTGLISDRTEAFTISDLYTYIIMHDINQKGIFRILVFFIFADDLQSYILDRIQISYNDKSVIDLFTLHYTKYQGGVELSHAIRFDELLMYCKVKINSVSVHNDRKALCFWKG